MSTFANFPLLPSLQATLAEKGLQTPTEIQERALPELLKGRSLVGVSETGSGKTLAFALPILHRLKTLENEYDPVLDESRPRAVVLVPTRELGEQVTKVFKPFTHTTRLRVRSVLGGTDLAVAKKNLQGKFEVLVATPGRLAQLIQRKLVDLSDVRTLVFDEADQMLDHGFLPDVGRIASACPEKIQMALFSATVSPPVQKLMDELFVGVPVIRSQGSHRVVKSLKTRNEKVPQGKRLPVLQALLSEKTSGGTILFVNTREQCDQLARALAEGGHACVVYRGEMDKQERRSNLRAFREGRIPLLVSTDLASRGLDLDHVGRVINYHMPQQMENYLHRVGRTARAGRSGLVVNLITERDEALLAKINRLGNSTAEEWPAEPTHKPKPALPKPGTARVRTGRIARAGANAEASTPLLRVQRRG